MKPKQILGLALIVVGILIAIYGIAIIPLSMVSIPGVQITDIPPRSAASIGVGAFVVLIGAYLFLGKEPDI
jgi:hypothetical protein